MGKKINPILFRLGKSTNYKSLWYTDYKNYKNFLKYDILLREIIKRNFFFIGLNYIDLIISNNLKINFYFNDIDYIVNFEKYLDLFIFEISKILKINIILNFILDKKVNSKMISNLLISQINNKISIKKLIKKEIIKLNNEFRGCKIQISGRIEGVDIARKEWFLYGRIPLHTIRYCIDFDNCEVITQYGVIGIKVWVFKK